jgi:adenylate cyclase
MQRYQKDEKMLTQSTQGHKIDENRQTGMENLKKHKMILVIADDPFDARLLERSLSGEGYGVETAGRYEDAYESVHLGVPDLIIVDMESQGPEGPEFCRSIRTDGHLPYIPIIFLAPEDARQAGMVGTLDTGVDFHIRKPIYALDLISRIKSVLRLKELNEEIMAIKSDLSHNVSPPTLSIADRQVFGESVQSDEVVDATVLFSDIRGFTRLSENMDPSGVFEMLNTSLSFQIETIEEHQGMIDKLSGDEVMAVFYGPEMARNALRCGSAIIRALRDQKSPLIDGRMGVGIGINTGPVFAGSLGSRGRQHYTVVGNTVNIAARFCGYAKMFQVLFGDSTRALVTHSDLEYRTIGKVPLKGISAPVEIFELLK